MKLSEIKGERTLDVIAEVIEPISNIASDETASALFRKEKAPEGMTAREFLMKRVKKSVPPLIKNHKEDIVNILASIKGVSAKTYNDHLNLVALTRDIIDLLTDEAFGALFISAQSGDSSGSAPENTEGPGA